MCAAAGLKNIFVGIETPNVESLRETKKRQNVGVNLTDQIQRFLDHGICITAGMIVGFDADGLDIFERQRDFSMAAPVPIFTLGALVAPAATPLHDRMQKEGRLISGGSEVAASPWNTNIVLRQMTSEQLMEGMRWLCNNLYHPQAFSDRVSRFINKLGAAAQPKGRYGGAQPFQAPRPLDIDCLQMLSGWTGYGAAERKMMEDISRLAATKPEAAPYIKPLLAQYMQIRFMYESGQFWEPYRFDAGLPIDPPSSSSSRVPIPIVPSRQVA